MLRLLHTPEGVRDIYGEESIRKVRMKSEIKQIINQYRYHSIDTPSFEHSDKFNL